MKSPAPDASPIRVLLFDLGHVVVRLDWDSAFEHWSRTSGVPVAQLRERYGIDDAYRRFERGEITSAQYFDSLRSRLGVALGHEDMETGWNAIFPGLQSPVIEAIRTWRTRLPVYALTNTNRSHRQKFMSQFPEEMALFEHIFDSSELGARKPEALVFDKVVAAIGVPPANILFFDDLAENIDGARQRGLQTVWVQQVDDTLRALEALGTSLCRPGY